jgi:hypothetical protein
MNLEKLTRRANAVLGTSLTADQLPKTTIGELFGPDVIERGRQLAKDAWRRHRTPFTSTGKLAAKYCSAA